MQLRGMRIIFAVLIARNLEEEQDAIWFYVSLNFWKILGGNIGGGQYVTNQSKKMHREYNQLYFL